MPKVSICVAQYNRADRVAISIGSLLSQSYHDYEVIVVNDGSTDNRTQVELEKLKCAKLTIIKQDNGGFVSAMNKAIYAAKGEYIAIHGAGDISLPDRIKTQSDYLDSAPSVGLVSCLFDNVVIDGEYSGKRTFMKKSSKVDVSDLLQLNNPFGQGEVMFRKDLFEKVGGYRSYFKYAQDRDLWLRMIEHTKMHIIQEKLYERGIFINDGIASNIEKTILQKYLSSLARACYYEKQANGIDFIEKYGKHAAFFRPPDPLLANFFAKQAVEYMLKDELEKGDKIASLALKEKITLSSFASKLILLLCKAKPIRLIMTKLFLALFPNSAKRYRS